LDSFPLRADGPSLQQRAIAGDPFTVSGPQGVIVGQQQGTFEAWVLPVKLLSHLSIEANVEGYAVPLDLDQMAREIQVQPDHTTITYSHIALTVRQIMFAPEHMPDGTGAVVLFQVDALHPVELTFRFTAEMRKMWPEVSTGLPAAEWVPRGTTGFYILHTDFPDFAGAVALPGATFGVMAPYQERPQVHPLEFRLHIDSRNDRGRYFPLLMAVGNTQATATNAALEQKLLALNATLPQMYAAHAARYRAEESSLTRIVTPDADLNADLKWAETSIGQLRAKAPDGELGLVAGYYTSGDSARPGFGWFFGRDALYTLYALDSYGDFPTSRMELEFLMRRQREDGKMMHEYSQTAGEVDWKSLPYEYAAADSTPLFLMVMLDYVRSSGDLEFLRAHQQEVAKAWHFETTHDADGDGVYDNSQGTGWVESWPTGMPKQEIYLALLDEQASQAMAGLSELLGDGSMVREAQGRAAQLHQTIEREYYRANADAYGFSQNQRTLDPSSTIYPAIAWWSEERGLDHPLGSLRRWASPDFATDWGSRDVAASDPLYDSMSYHQGSVWPLFTGWAAMAQYRSGNLLAGYQSTMQNAGLTRAQDLGAVTELLSGDFFEPFGRSTSHQLWSSAMVVTPVLRGMFGITVNAVEHSLRVVPRLPADWSEASVEQLHVGASIVNLRYRRAAGSMEVRMEVVSGPVVSLEGAINGLLRVTLPGVEVSVPHGLPLRGSRTTQMKVVTEHYQARSLRLELMGTAGSTETLTLRRNNVNDVRAEGAELNGAALRVTFGPGQGYVTQNVTLHW
jgi:glycogen debranching enzyme